MRTTPALTNEPSAVARQLLQGWADRCDVDGFVPRSAIDPVLDFRAISAHLMLLRRIGERFQFRVVGSQVVQLSGRDVTGRWVDPELYGRQGDRFHCMLDQSCRTGRAFVFMGAPSHAVPVNVWTAETVGFPMRRDGEREGFEVLATFALYGSRRYPSGEVHDQVMREAAWYAPDEVAGMVPARR